MILPGATADLPPALPDLVPASGIIKADYEDFCVEELPLYEASGTGTHTYFLLEKAGLSTMQAVHDIARALNVGRRDIGYAGLKDARAVTRQWMSIEHVEPERLMALEIPRLRVLDVSRHSNKLRLGHLHGNRFVIKVRQTEPERLAEFQDALATLAQRGVPNYFGQQRFGGRGDSWAVGQAILRGDTDTALDIALGRPLKTDHGSVRRARVLYEQGKYLEAARAWPGMFRDERRALKALAKTGGKKRRGFLAIDKATRRFYVSAYQSYLFNAVVAARVPNGLEQLWAGDLAWIHASDAVFAIDDPTQEQPRADRFEISPSGPLFGYRMSQPTGAAGELEATILSAERLEPEAFRSGPLRVKGARRPLRFRPADPEIRLGADQRGAYLELRFALPRGCYATVLLRNLFRIETPGATTSNGDGAETGSS
ncbi:MAG: tRNA pseudouridine(13) synthase TruD [Planctomycetes bacterium]|nr:tRNA pseudouridine(13) synthase TruD [Planctomycetota bacterium]